MSLKYQIESLEGLDESIQSLYTEVDGKYQLKVDGLDDGAELKRAKEHEKEARKRAEAEAKQLRAEMDEMKTSLDEIKSKKARDSGDIDALEKSWADKLAKREAELSAQIEKANGSITSLLVDKEAATLAASLAVEGSAGILLPHIKQRLGVAEKDGSFVTVVNDGEGKPSALTIEELKQEFANNPAFAPVIVGSKASGGGASGGSGGGAASGKSWGDLKTTEERVAHIKAKQAAGGN